MSLVDQLYFMYPAIVPASSNSPMNMASGEKVAFGIMPMKSGNVRKVHFMLGTTTTGETLKGSLQNGDTSGFPDGTIDQSGTVAVVNTDDNVPKSVTLGTDRAVTMGEMVFFVIEWNATEGNLQILSSIGYSFGYTNVLRFTAGAWAHQNRSPIVVLEYDDGSVAPCFGALPGYHTSNVFASNTALADERGRKFTLNFPAKCIGLVANFNSSGGIADFDAVLYDTDGTTVLRSCSVDGSYIRSNGTYNVFPFSSPVTLNKNVAYRAVIKPTTTTAIELYKTVLMSSAFKVANAGGVNFIGTRRVDAGAWTDEDTEQPNVFLILSALDDASGTGITRLMNGGFIG